MALTTNGPDCELLILRSIKHSRSWWAPRGWVGQGAVNLFPKGPASSCKGHKVFLYLIIMLTQLVQQSSPLQTSNGIICDLPSYSSPSSD